MWLKTFCILCFVSNSVDLCTNRLVYCRFYANNCNSCIGSYAVNATLDCKHELLGVDHRCPLVLALFSSLSVSPPLLALAPKVGTAVHAGNVENSYAFQRDAAEVQGNTITLLEKKRERGEKDRV